MSGSGDPSGAGDPSGSIIERFRGTQWDVTPPELPPPPQPRGPGPGVLIAAGLVLLIAVVAGSSYLLLTGAPAPSPTPYVAVATDPPTPTKAPGADVTTPFWALVDDFNVSYHLDSSGSLSTKGSDQRFAQKWTMSIDAAGDNFVGTLSIAGRGKFVWDRYDGTIYLKQIGTSKWEKTPTSDPSFRQAPFMALDDHRELAYVGPVVEGGRTLHKLVGTAAYRPSVARMFALAWFEFPFTAVDEHFELFVTDQGVPVRATFSSTVVADPAHKIPGFSGTVTFTFKAFGQGPKISSPPTR